MVRRGPSRFSPAVERISRAARCRVGARLQQSVELLGSRAGGGGGGGHLVVVVLEGGW